MSTILLVEDNPDDVDLTIRAFRRVTPAPIVRTASDGVEALDDLLGRNGSGPPGPLPAVVLLDLKLPRLDGFSVLRRIRANARTQFLPVVVLTSSSELMDLELSYELGANSYVRKPVSFSQFLDVTQQLARYWLSLNQAPPAR
jgi:two-component system response regulator